MDETRFMLLFNCLNLGDLLYKIAEFAFFSCNKKKVYNDLGKVEKYWTSRPLFSWRKSLLKKMRAHCAPCTNMVKMIPNQIHIEIHVQMPLLQKRGFGHFCCQFSKLKFCF